MNYCQWCGARCGSGGFCDEACYTAWLEACQERQQSDDLPGESRYAGDDFSSEWDVAGGL